MMFNSEATQPTLSWTGRFATMAMVVVALWASQHQASAQSLNCDGAWHSVSYDSNHAPQAFTIPQGSEFIKLRVRGAAGGDAQAGGGACERRGGRGALATATFRVGTGTNELEPGGTLRFIVGQRGGSRTVSGSTRSTGSGGGGGSAVLYVPPGATSPQQITLLLVAGGGGGAHAAYFGGCTNGQSGGNGRAQRSGGDSGSRAGGNGGGAGDTLESSSRKKGGGGGGSRQSASTTFGGSQGWLGGGSGGGTNNSVHGGWGYGGGGAGSDHFSVASGSGGGGGYSGGAAGGHDHRSGGGGSFVENDWVVSKMIVVSNSRDHGEGAYICLDQLGGETCAEATPINDGSYTGDTTGFAPQSPVLNCNGFPILGSKSAWYSYSNPHLFPIQVTASTCSTSGTSSAVSLVVLESCQNPSPPYLACGTSCSGTIRYETVTWDMQPGETHLLRVTTMNPGNALGSTYRLVVNSTIMPINHDICATAVEVFDGDPKLSSLYGATPDPVGTSCGNSFDDAWFFYDNMRTDEICVTVMASPILSSARLILEARNGDCANSSRVFCSVASTAGPTTLTWNIPGGTRSWFRVANQVSGANVLFGLELLTNSRSGIWTDLENSLAPVGGTAPVLSGTGTLCAGGSTSIDVTGAGSNTHGIMILGLSEISIAWLGGVLVPSPDIILPVQTDANGESSFRFVWPAGVASQASASMQVWLPDAAGVMGFVATNALLLTTR